MSVCQPVHFHISASRPQSHSLASGPQLLSMDLIQCTSAGTQHPKRKKIVSRLRPCCESKIFSGLSRTWHVHGWVSSADQRFFDNRQHFLNPQIKYHLIISVVTEVISSLVECTCRYKKRTQLACRGLWMAYCLPTMASRVSCEFWRAHTAGKMMASLGKKQIKSFFGVWVFVWWKHSTSVVRPAGVKCYRHGLPGAPPGFIMKTDARQSLIRRASLPHRRRYSVGLSASVQSAGPCHGIAPLAPMMIILWLLDIKQYELRLWNIAVGKSVRSTYPLFS